MGGSRSTGHRRAHSGQFSPYPDPVIRGLGSVLVPLGRPANRVHLADGYECLIRYGEHWRAVARADLDKELN